MAELDSLLAALVLEVELITSRFPVLILQSDKSIVCDSRKDGKENLQRCKIPWPKEVPTSKDEIFDHHEVVNHVISSSICVQLEA